ncbi:MAG: hypothetical protein IT450_15850, partial [Phycisphaerales bacterium]|nr:hypothetical protein [Phycisphaerales bacterium]
MGGRMVSVVRAVACSVALAVSAAVAQDKTNYNDHVRPLLARSCLNCHNADRARGGLDLSTYAGAISGGSSGKVLASGDLGASPLFGSISHTREPKMPPNRPRLPDDEIAVIKAWIEQGLLESASSAPVARKKLDLAFAGAAAGTAPEPITVTPTGLPMNPPVETARADAITAVAAHPASPLVAIATQQAVAVYATDSLQLVGVLPFSQGSPRALRFSRTGQLLIGAGGIGAQSGRVDIWSIVDGRRVATVGDEPDVALTADIDPAQRRVVLGGPTRVVKIYNIADGALLSKIQKHTDWVTAVAYSPDGILLATADRAGNLHVWEAESLAPFYTLNGHPSAVTSLDWRADSNVLATTCEDGQIRLWNMQNGGLIKAWGAHGGGATSVRFTRDGRLITAGRDRTVKLWNADGGAARTFPAMNDLALTAATDAAGLRVIGGDWSGVVRVWKTDDGAVLGDLAAAPPSLVRQKEAAAARQAAARAVFDAKNQEFAAAKAAADMLK